MRTIVRCGAWGMLVFLFAGCGGQNDSNPAAGRIRNPALAPQIGHAVPEIDGEDIEGTRLKLSDYRGKVVIVDFWGFWCPHCIKLIPHEKALVERMNGRPFALLGVNSDHNRAETAKISYDKAINWRSWWDGSEDGPIARTWQPEGFPMLYVIDHRGILRAQNFLIDARMEELIERLVREAETEKS